MNRDHGRRHHEQRLREVRLRVAHEAARILAESGGGDFNLARRKAAERLAVVDEASLPRNSEIEAALREYQRIFRGDSQPGALRARREAAIEAMRFFSAFEPRLVGAVLDGTADEHSPVILHIFSDDALAVRHFLAEQRIAFDEREQRVRLDRERVAAMPMYAFDADGIAMQLVVFARDDLRQAPLDRDEQPMTRATRAAVAALLDSTP